MERSEEFAMTTDAGIEERRVGWASKHAIRVGSFELAIRRADATRP
jgi:hypothetical protein